MSGWLFCSPPSCCQKSSKPGGGRTMWSLPDIQRLNAEAASATARKTILKAVHQHLDSLGNPIHCDYCGNEAEAVTPWFDIFGDDAKGVVALCQEHYDKIGPVPGGYF